MDKIIKERIESELEVKSYIQNLKYALDEGAKINFQINIRVDTERNEKFTNQYMVNTTTFVMSFHYAERAFTAEMFPYRKKGENL